MLFDPDDGKTWEQKIEAVVGRLHPDKREMVMAEAKARGCSIQDFVEDCVQVSIDAMKDPVYRAAMHAKSERDDNPYGLDPLLRKDA